MKMVKMYHDDPIATAGPTTADVPEGGVAMMRAAGWHTKDELAEMKKEAPKPQKAKANV
ncbi:MAG: hypothetical protein PHN64_03820 [Desulfovibrionaceae bacterium]|nr:hypothetical protein [Desulfovibrionaceae bacterium]